ncbi:MAG: transposase, partial [Rhodobacteraceae bacterium]|nr:transposase [Paracoccaceae bacterium]
NFERESPQKWVNFERDSTTYRELPNQEWVNHSAGEYVRGDVHTNSIESFWSMFKRGFHGTYHHMGRQHLHRYVQEFEGRQNVREMDTIDQMETMVRRMERKRLKYSVLTGRET